MRGSRRLAFAFATSIRPGSSDVRMTSRCAAIGLVTATGLADGSSARSVADETKPNVTTSCQSRAARRRRSANDERCDSGFGSMRCTCARGSDGIAS
jgi:hypothetical protein